MSFDVSRSLEMPRMPNFVPYSVKKNSGGEPQDPLLILNTILIQIEHNQYFNKKKRFYTAVTFFFFFFCFCFFFFLLSTFLGKSLCPHPSLFGAELRHCLEKLY